MRKAKIITKKTISIEIESNSKKEFDFLLETIKGIKGRQYKQETREWQIPKNKGNLLLLKSLDFRIIDLLDINNIKRIDIVVKTNRVSFKTNKTGTLVIKNLFTFKDYSSCFSKGKFNKNKIKDVSFVKTRGQTGILPIGLFSKLKEIVISNKIPYSVIDKRSFEEFDFTREEISGCLNYLKLYDYQVESIISCFKQRIGIIKLPTSAGKTEIFLAICKLMKLKTLILFNRIELSEQTLKRAKEANIDSGIVQGDNFDEDHEVVICTVQSANKLKGRYEVLIVDECHRAISEQYQSILSEKSFKYRFGFSATPFPKDRYKTAVINKYLGDIIYTLPASYLIENKKIAEPYITFIEINSPSKVLKEEKNWVRLEKEGIINNKKRNLEIVSICKSAKGATLILVKKIKHGEILKGLMKDAVFINGGSSSESRAKEIIRFEKGEDSLLIASTIFDEGVSLKNIKNLIITGGGKSYILAVQRLGRGLRLKEGKESVNVFDFFDNFSDILKTHSEHRYETYLKEGFKKIKIIKKF